MLLLQVLILGGSTILCWGDTQVPTECDPSKKPLKKDVLDGNMKLPDTYKVSGIITNWVVNTTTSFTEAADSSGLATVVSSRNYNLQWLKLKLDERVFLHNKTSGNCATYPSAPLSNFTELSAISQDLSSFSAVISGLLEFSKTYPGELRNNSLVAGIDGVHWVSCVNSKDGADNLQVEVVFAGDASLKPPSPAFKNPLILLIQVSAYGNFSDQSTLKSKLSVELDHYDKISADDAYIFSTPAGTICDGWNETGISLDVSDPFSVAIETFNDGKDKHESVVYYSTKEQLVFVGGGKSGDVMPFVNEMGLPEGVTSVVHDFTTGYEYAMDDNSRCLRLSALPNNSADVIAAQSIISMQPLSEMLIPTGIKFGKYGQVEGDDGTKLDVFRARDSKANYIVELHLDGKRLKSFQTFKLADGHPKLSSYKKYSMLPNVSVEQIRERTRGCFVNFAAELENNTYVMEVKSKTVKDVFSRGVETVTFALAEAFSQLAPINPLRVRAFYGSGPLKALNVFFVVGEKVDVAPAEVAKFNFTAEVSTSELLNKFNDTVLKGDWKFSVPSSVTKNEDWVVTASSLKRYMPLPSTPSGGGYSGYTGGAMFVLGIFSLVLGVAIGAGGVFFITKRQHISTLAYQVFE